MKRILFVVTLVAALLVVFGSLGGSAFACPNCYGDPDSSMTSGMNMAIISLLGVTGGVLASFVGFFLFLRKRIQGLNERFINRLN
jgi:hypothetical protein